jgi:hypothetical protein
MAQGSSVESHVVQENWRHSLTPQVSRDRSKTRKTTTTSCGGYLLQVSTPHVVNVEQSSVPDQPCTVVASISAMLSAATGEGLQRREEREEPRWLSAYKAQVRFTRTLTGTHWWRYRAQYPHLLPARIVHGDAKTAAASAPRRRTQR